MFQKKSPSIVALAFDDPQRHLDEIHIKDKDTYILAKRKTRLANWHSKLLMITKGIRMTLRKELLLWQNVHCIQGSQFNTAGIGNSLKTTLIFVEIIEIESYIVWYRPPSDPVDSLNKLKVTLSYLEGGKETVLFGWQTCWGTFYSEGKNSGKLSYRSIYVLPYTPLQYCEAISDQFYQYMNECVQCYQLSLVLRLHTP